MFFRQVEEIKARRKTNSRRVKKSGEWLALYCIVDSKAVVTKKGHVKYRTGNTYPVIPKRGQKAIPDGRIKLLDIREEPVQSISYADALAEGVGSIEEYRLLWESINTDVGTRWTDNPQVWVYVFEYVEAVRAEIA